MLWLTQRQLRSKNVALRRRAAEELSRTPQPRAFKALRAALGDGDPEVRRLAVIALGHLDEDRSMEPLMSALRDRDVDVVKAGIQVLKRTSSDERVVALLAGLIRHQDAAVRGRAALALEFLAWRPASKEDELWLLVAKGQFSRVAAYGIAALPALELVLNSGPSSLGVAAVDALGAIGDQRSLRALLQALKSSDPAICIAATGAVANLGGSEAGDAIQPLMRHANGQVRLAAAEALGQLRVAAAVEPLRALLRDSQWDVRRTAAEALGRIGDAQAVEALTRTLDDGDADVREATAMALGTLSDRRAIGPLVKALKDSTSGVRRIAAAALSRIDEDWSASGEARAAIEELKASLQDEDPSVRHFVGQLLVSLGAAEQAPAKGPEFEEAAGSSPAKRRKLAVSLFISILCDSDRDLRQAAAESLGRIGDERAESALTRAMADPDPGVRLSAERALPLLSGGRA